jgi:hypothetical protein
VLQYKPTDELTTDTLTKPLQGYKWTQHQRGLQVFPSDDAIVSCLAFSIPDFEQRGVLESAEKPPDRNPCAESEILAIFAVTDTLHDDGTRHTNDDDALGRDQPEIPP